MDVSAEHVVSDCDVAVALNAMEECDYEVYPEEMGEAILRKWAKLSSSSVPRTPLWARQAVWARLRPMVREKAILW